jgi:hypothetical protein
LVADHLIAVDQLGVEVVEYGLAETPPVGEVEEHCSATYEGLVKSQTLVGNELGELTQ